MIRLSPIPFALLLAVVCSHAVAQDRSPGLRRDGDERIVPSHESSPRTLTPTPEMWFYEQERQRHDDPKLAVQHRAELRGSQRQDRLASLKWYGISNSRPTVSNSPCFGSYAPYWGSNTSDFMRWRNAPVAVQRPNNVTY